MIKSKVMKFIQMVEAEGMTINTIYKNPKNNRICFFEIKTTNERKRITVWTNSKDKFKIDSYKTMKDGYVLPFFKEFSESDINDALVYIKENEFILL